MCWVPFISQKAPEGLSFSLKRVPNGDKIIMLPSIINRVSL